MQQCAVAAREVGGLGILDDAHYLRRVVEKLPEWLGHRWASTVSRTKVDKRRYPLFHELVAFVTLEADISNDPVFGTLPPPIVCSIVSVASLRSPRQFATSVGRLVTKWDDVRASSRNPSANVETLFSNQAFASDV